jgi:exosortase family protein XrtF
MIKKYLQDPKQRQIIFFLVKAVLLYTIWFISYDFFIAPNGALDACLDDFVAGHAANLLTLLGYNGSIIPGIDQTIVQINGVSMVGVGDPCNGLELFVLFAGFIICFPGNIKQKLYYIPIGIIIIYIANVIRTMLLSLIQLKAPEYLELNHHYTFTIIVYSIIFFLWMYWVNNYSALKKQPKQA